MGVYSYAYLLYGIELDDEILYKITSDEEYQFFDMFNLKYIEPTEYVCKQYTPLLGLELAKLDECDNPKKVVIPNDLTTTFKATFLILLNKLEEMYIEYEAKEYDFSKEDLEGLRTKLEGMWNTLDPSFYLAIRKF